MRGERLRIGLGFVIMMLALGYGAHRWVSARADHRAAAAAWLSTHGRADELRALRADLADTTSDQEPASRFLPRINRAMAAASLDAEALVGVRSVAGPRNRPSRSTNPDQNDITMQSVAVEFDGTSVADLGRLLGELASPDNPWVIERIEINTAASLSSSAGSIRTRLVATAPSVNTERSGIQP